jgi:hypothetical protein
VAEGKMHPSRVASIRAHWRPKPRVVNFGVNGRAILITFLEVAGVVIQCVAVPAGVQRRRLFTSKNNYVYFPSPFDRKSFC